MISIHGVEWINANQVPGGLVYQIHEKWSVLIEPNESCYVDLLIAALDQNGVELLKMLDEHQRAEGLPAITKATIQLWQDKQKGRNHE